MRFDPILAVTRFGAGLSPAQPLPRDLDDFMAELEGPDEIGRQHRIPPFARTHPSMQAYGDAQRKRREARGTQGEAAAEARLKEVQRLSRDNVDIFLRLSFARSIDARFGLRERLVAFWADHFTVKARNGPRRQFISPYVEEAIRPHVTGPFNRLLRAADTHPMMLLYLQQADSVGPNSQIGQRRGRGLNENLAREMMELHTLGVDGAYTQTDVQELAALLSGLTFTPNDGLLYDPRRAEPGAETVLGVSYGADATSDVIVAAMDDLARHPSTARHIAQKLAAHFVADDPAPDLVATIAAAFQDTDGDLMASYRAMLTHPAAWHAEPQKVRPPFDFIVAAARSLGVPGAAIVALDQKATRRLLSGPLRVMGQSWQNPPGPDGWADRAEDWIIPQTMAGRISWAMRAPESLTEALPDPRDLVGQALGPNPDGAVVFAAGASETRRDGVGVIFASAAFNRR